MEEGCPKKNGRNNDPVTKPPKWTSPQGLVTHSDIDPKELAVFMEKVGIPIMKEVIEQYNNEPI